MMNIENILRINQQILEKNEMNGKICSGCLKKIRGLKVSDNGLLGELSHIHDNCFEQIIIKWINYPRVLPEKQRHYY